MIRTTVPPDDLGNINEVRTSNKMDELPEDWLQKTEKQETFVFLEAGRLVGYIMIRPRIGHDNDCLFDVYVDPNFHRKGIGTQLIKHTIIWVENSNQYSRLTLEVEKDKTDAIRLYEHLDFKIINTDSIGHVMVHSPA